MLTTELFIFLKRNAVKPYVPVFPVYMQSWEWTCYKIIPELLEMLERTKLDYFAVAVAILLGQLGRYF